eukprot:306356-Amphidinium_carterae.1
MLMCLFSPNVSANALRMSFTDKGGLATLCPPTEAAHANRGPSSGLNSCSKVDAKLKRPKPPR